MELIVAGPLTRREALGRCLLLKDNRKPALADDRSPRHELLFANPIVDIWRICFVANSFVFPLYRDMELTWQLTRPEFVTLLCLGTAGALVAQDIVVPQNGNTMPLATERQGRIEQTQHRSPALPQAVDHHAGMAAAADHHHRKIHASIISPGA